MTLYSSAFELAERKLATTLPRRWEHVQGVAERARSLRPISGFDADLLESAAILHDIGYAPDIAHARFHPLDGARFLRSLETPTRLVNLVAHHSYAALEARLRGLSDELGAFHDEEGILRDALWHCDLTTNPDGQEVSIDARIGEIKYRYGPGHLVTEFIIQAEQELRAATDRTLSRLSLAEESP